MAKSIRRPGPVHIAVATAATLAAGTALPVTASEIQDAYRAHTALCFRLLLSDKPAHNEQCLPNSMPNIPAHGGGSDSGPPPVVVAPPPPPVVVADPEVESSYPEVDSSYPEAFG